MASNYIKITDQFGDFLTLSVNEARGLAYVNVRAQDPEDISVELTPDDVRDLRDWCTEMLGE